jgi:hypothetical protein
MKINMNATILGLDGTELAESNIGKVVAQMLVQSSKGDALKFWHWAQKLYAGKELDLDPSDSEVLKNFIKDNEQLTILVKAQALACFPNK